MVRTLKEPVEEEPPLRWPIALIIIAAFAVRLFGLGYGLPYSFDNDENRVIKQAYRFAMVSPRPASPEEPVFMSYIVAGEYGAFFGIGHVFGRFGPLHEFQAYYLTNPSAFILIARCTSVALGLLSIYLLFFLGKQIFGWGTGLLAAALAAFAPQHIRFSQLATADMLAFVFVTAGAYFAFKFVIEKRLGDVFTAALLMGFAAAAADKYALFLALVYIIYIIVAPREYKVTAILIGLLVTAVAFLFGFFVPNAMLLLAPLKFITALWARFPALIDTRAFASPSAMARTFRALLFPDAATGGIIGYAMLSTGLLGILWGIANARFKRTLFVNLFLALLVPVVLFMPAGLDGFLRWKLVMTIPLALGSSYLGYRLFWRKKMPAAVGIILLIVYGVGVTVESDWRVPKALLRKTADDTRTQFSEWTLDNLPHLAKVVATPQARYLFDVAGLRPGDAFAMWRRSVLEAWNGRGFQVTVAGDTRGGPSAFDPSQFDYAAFDDWTLDRLEGDPSNAAATLLSRIREVRESHMPVARFSPADTEKGYGPSIEVYSLEPPPAPETPQP